MRRLFLVQALILPVAVSAARAQLGDCPAFVRGDANGDGSVDLSDAVATLLHLFSSGAAPTCLDAADADDTGRIELTDAVYTLGFLFLGQPEPPAPGAGGCGRDPTHDDLECDSSPACQPAARSRDFSAFTTFETRQDSGLGFCPDGDRPYKAEIVRQEDGAFTVTLTHLRAGTPGVDECLLPFDDPMCWVLEKDAERPLAAEEVETMLGLFAAVEVFDEVGAICHCVAIDPCRVDVFTWDKQRVDGFVCSAPRLDEADAAVLLEFVRNL